MRDSAKNAAKRFLKKYRLTRIDSKSLQDVLNRQGSSNFTGIARLMPPTAAMSAEKITSAA